MAGSGYTASGPEVSLADNDIDHLVADIDALRDHLGVDAWIVNAASLAAAWHAPMR